MLTCSRPGFPCSSSGAAERRRRWRCSARLSCRSASRGSPVEAGGRGRGETRGAGEGRNGSAFRNERKTAPRGGARDVLVVLTSRFSFPSPKSFFILSLFRRALETWGAKRKPRTPKTVPPTRTPDQKPPEPSPLLLDACKVFPLSATSFLCLRTASEPESGRAEREGLDVADAAPRLRAAPPLSPVLDDGAVLAC